MQTVPSDTTSSQFQEPGRRRLQTRWLEWSLLSALLLALVVFLSASRTFEHIDLALTDQLYRLQTRPVSDDIVIVAIDDKSLAEVGRWPWRRATHAALLQKISAGQPRAVGLDLILVEPDAPRSPDEALLAQAIGDTGKVVLPMVLQDRLGTGQLLRTEPAQALGAHAAALGHIHLEIDADGIVRSTFLREGDGER